MAEKYSRVQGWDQWIPVGCAKRGRLFITVLNPSASVSTTFLACTNKVPIRHCQKVRGHLSRSACTFQGHEGMCAQVGTHTNFWTCLPKKDSQAMIEESQPIQLTCSEWPVSRQRSRNMSENGSSCFVNRCVCLFPKRALYSRSLFDNTWVRSKVLHILCTPFFPHVSPVEWSRENKRCRCLAPSSPNPEDYEAKYTEAESEREMFTER